MYSLCPQGLKRMASVVCAWLNPEDRELESLLNQKPGKDLQDLLHFVSLFSI
jgi:hypothetical protein